MESFYYFGLDGELNGVLIKANDDVLVMFNADLDWIAYAVSNTAGGYNLFDLDGEWIGYFCDNSGSNFNRFSLDGDWIGFTT